MVKELLTFSPANKPRYRPRRAFFALCLLTTAIFCITATINTAEATTYYLDAVNGNDSNNPGTSSLPWKTITKAQSVVQAGDTVKLRTGNYGAFTQTLTTDNTDWITWTNDTGATPVFTKITISAASLKNAYLKFDGINIQHTNYTPTPDGHWHTIDYDANAPGYLVNVDYANYIQFLNGDYQGCDKYISKGVIFDRSSNVLIQHCEVHTIASGITFYTNGVTDSSIKNCYIHEITEDTAVKILNNCSGILIENNHICDQNENANDTYYPSLETLHPGSGIGIRSSNVTIRKNIVHAGFVQGIMFYSDGDIPYHDMIVENNLFYDTGKNWLIEIGGAATIRNNTFIGCIGDERINAWYRILSRYTGDSFRVDFADGFDGSGVDIYNNICVDYWNFPTDPGSQLFNEDYNISWGRVDTTNTTKGIHSLIVTWSVSGNEHGWPNYLEDIGYRSPPTPEYTYSAPVQPFFVDPNYYTNWQVPALAFGNYKFYDYHLAAGSPGINFGNASNQPSDSLGTIGPDGFINDDGPVRNASHHSVGCYEYVSAQTYNLSITAVNGTVAKSPDNSSYNSGETVTLQATPNTGYHFVNWTGDVTDTNSSVTITMNSNKSVTANFAINTYTLTITATNGSVTKTPDKSPYNYSDTVTLAATANTGYHFSNWSGDASGTSSTTTIVMNSNKSVTANFSINTYSLTVETSNGSVTKTPDKTSYNYGEQVTLQAVPNTGYHFSSWSGSASGTSNPTAITMNADKSVTANFAINTYALNITAVFGSVTRTPSKTVYNHGETVSIQAVPNTGYAFTGWAGDASGSSNPVTLTIDSDKSVTANFVYTLVDNNAPSIAKSSCYPLPNAIQVPLNTLLVIHIVDEGRGIDANTVSIEVNNNIIYKGTGNVSSYSSVYGRCYRTGNIARFIYTYQPYQNFDFDQSVTVAASAADLASNQMSDSYSFRTEMLSFGKNLEVESGTDSLADGHPATVRDSSGNIWAVWHKGNVGSRDIYIGKLTAEDETFGTSIQLTNDASDQCNPAIAKDSTDKLYVVWQDNRRGNWDIYVSTFSVGETNWSAATRITDSNANQVNPAIAIDRSSPNKVYVAWQDDQNINQDIFVATSTNSFLTKTIAQVTSDNSDQTEPTIVTDAANTAYIFWTDLRNGSKDIYGAASTNGSWSNVALVTGSGDQSEPAVAAETIGTTLHFLWVDNSSGNKGIFYASCSGGLHALSDANASITDGNSGADQPSISVTGSTGNNLKVFACWRDGRNTDADLYFLQIGSSSTTNIFVGDDGTGATQSNPVVGIDASGYPYLLWVDNRNTIADIFYAGSTHARTNPLLSQNVSMTSGATVGVSESNINGTDDVSVVIPAGAYLCDVNITVSRVENPPNLSPQLLSVQYEFGPSGITFEQPVTIIIPYIVSGSGTATAYWYNTLTAASSREGITNLKDITISDTLHAIRFQTTHFTTFFVGSGGSSGSSGSGGGGGGGGGCSLAPPGKNGNIIGFVLPFLALGLVITVIKRRDGQNRKRSLQNLKKV